MVTPLEKVPVRLVPDLCAAALKQKQDKELALWYCLRHLNITGCGRIPLEAALDGLTRVFGYSRRTAFRHLKLGEGHCWERFPSIKGQQIRIYSLKTVAQHLGTSITDKHWREISPEMFTCLKKRRAAMYAAMHKPEGILANPISRQSLEERTGCCSRRQRRYDVEAGIRRTSNFGVVQTADATGKPMFKPATMIVAGKSREYTIPRRLPNSYHSRALPGHRGMLPRVSKALDGGSSRRGEAPEPTRRYFRDSALFLRSLKGVSGMPTELRERYILVPSGKHAVRTHMEWLLQLVLT